jgi:hypothetical protein
MNKLLKSTLIAGGVMGAVFATEANAQSFNVVVNEIELVSDADNYLSTANTVYKPAVGMGAATTTTVDFFNTSSRTFSLTKPQVGVYESMVVHFDTATVSGTTATLDLTTAYNNSLFNSYGGRNIMVFGNIGAGVNSIATITASPVAIPMQPVVVTSTGFSVPEFNWNLPSANVQDGTAVSLISSMDPYTLASNVDSSSVPDVMLDIDSSVFDGVTDFTSGSSNITVGLFADADLGPRPMFRQTYTASNQDGTGADKTVTFYDVPAGTVYPVAWFDKNNNKELDKGEATTMHSFTVATAAQTVAAADISYTATKGILDEAVVDFGNRGFALTIPMSDLDGATAALVPADGTFNASGMLVTDAGAGPLATTAWTASSGTALVRVAYEIFDDGTNQVDRTFDLAVGYGQQTGNGDGTIDSGEAMHVVMANAAANSISGVTFTPASETLVISNIPYTAINTVSAENIGAYDITIRATDNTTPTTLSSGLNMTEVGGTGAQVETPVSASITVVVGDGDASDTDGIADLLNLGTL